MKKLYLFFAFFACFFFFLIINKAQAEEISDFTETINIQKDGSLIVEEVISYDFQGESKHGIYRDIPFKYKARGGNYNLRLEVVSVTDGTDHKYNYTVSNQGDNKQIKIGDADILVEGKKIYNIKYRIKRAINFFNDNDELYWNVTGDKWPVEIKQTKAIIVLPEISDEAGLKMDCFSGPTGSTDQCVSSRFEYLGVGKVKEAVFIDDILQAGYGFTIVLALPKGLVDEPTLISKLIDTVKDNFILALPLLVFIFFYYLWHKKGRDARGRGTIVAQFDAPVGLSPMAVGTLYDEKADNKDFSANIINLAVKGYLKIVQTEQGLIFKRPDYALLALSSTQPITKSERSILDAIFKEDNLETDAKKIAEIKTLANLSEFDKMVFLSDLKNVFYKALSKIKSDIYAELAEQGYYKNNPQNVRTGYTVFGIFLIFFGIFVGSILGLLAIFSIVLSGFIVIIFARIMPAKTAKGALAKEYIRGLRVYLNVAEKDRINFHNAPEKKPEIFETLLPFAMVLGVEKQWAKQFADLYIDRQPSWYAGSNTNVFSSMALVNSLKSFSTSAGAVASSAPSSASSGGSGFSGGGSGGGFGGGGGGSW